MFVMNCKVDPTEVLKYPQQSATASKKNKTKRQKPKEGSTSDTPGPEASSSRSDPETLNTDSDTDVYHPVRCTSCTTEVGVCDQEELYHFFNVLASYSWISSISWLFFIVKTSFIVNFLVKFFTWKIFFFCTKHLQRPSNCGSGTRFAKILVVSQVETLRMNCCYGSSICGSCCNKKNS